MIEDIPLLARRDTTDRVTNLLERAWEQELAEFKQTTKWTLWRAIYKAYTFEIIWSGIFTFLEAVLFIVQPVILKYFVQV